MTGQKPRSLSEFIALTDHESLAQFSVATGIPLATLDLIDSGVARLDEEVKSVIRKILPDIPDALIEPMEFDFADVLYSGRPANYHVESITGKEIVPGDYLGYVKSARKTGWVLVEDVTPFRGKSVRIWIEMKDGRLSAAVAGHSQILRVARPN